MRPPSSDPAGQNSSRHPFRSRSRLGARSAVPLIAILSLAAAAISLHCHKLNELETVWYSTCCSAIPGSGVERSHGQANAELRRVCEAVYREACGLTPQCRGRAVSSRAMRARRSGPPLIENVSCPPFGHHRIDRCKPICMSAKGSRSANRAHVGFQREVDDCFRRPLKSAMGRVRQLNPTTSRHSDIRSAFDAEWRRPRLNGRSGTCFAARRRPTMSAVPCLLPFDFDLPNDAGC